LDLRPVSDVMGEDIIVGCPAMSRACARRIAREGSGQPGGAGRLVALLHEPEFDACAPGGTDGPIFIALGPTRVAFFVHNPGFFLSSTGMLLAVHERGDVRGLVFRPARAGASRLTFAFAGDTTYDVEVALPHRGKAHLIAEALEASARAA
jgi:hypothetical protein